MTFIWKSIFSSDRFHRNLERVQSKINEFDFTLLVHTYPDSLHLPSTLVDELVLSIEKILSGELVGCREKTFADDRLRCNFGSSGIVYRPDRIN